VRKDGKTPEQRRKSTAEMVQTARSFIWAAARRMARGETDNTAEDTLPALLGLHQTVDEAAAWLVGEMRKDGVTDAMIADMLGVSRPAVSQRWPGHGAHLGTAARFKGKRE
jgi:hypothetical protein